MPLKKLTGSKGSIATTCPSNTPEIHQ